MGSLNERLSAAIESGNVYEVTTLLKEGGIYVLTDKGSKWADPESILETESQAMVT
jgi:hypothetical protein